MVKLFQRLLNVITILITIWGMIEIYDRGFQPDLIFIGGGILYGIVLIINYISFNKITLWHKMDNE